jgi:hypothetical protein
MCMSTTILWRPHSLHAYAIRGIQSQSTLTWIRFVASRPSVDGGCNMHEALTFVKTSEDLGAEIQRSPCEGNAAEMREPESQVLGYFHQKMTHGRRSIG